MLKKILKSTIIVIIILILALSGNVMIALAVSQSDLDEINGKINDTEDKIDYVGTQLSSAMEQIRSLNAEIAEYENDIDDLDEQISEVNAKIETAENDIKKAEEEYNEQENRLKRRLVALYKAGNTTYLDVLLSSKNMVDFINRYYYVTELAECDQNLMEQIEENRLEIEETKKLLETSKEQIESLKKSKEDTARSLKNSQAMKQTYIDQLNDEEKALQDELEQFEIDKKQIQEELERIAKQNNPGVVAGSPSEAGYIFPVQGLNIYNINVRSYPSYPGHTGVDININVKGRNVIAAKAGTVITSTAARYANGEYRGYGEYVIIDHHDGTMTLYAHMSPGTRTVVEGQNVAQGQILGIVGTTGNSTGYHLHFEVRINGRCVNPLPYFQ